ncbi:MAG: hypothetical protein AB4041_04900 [Microcystaceae cyanobacterium]
MIKRWQDFIKEHFIQTVSTEQSYCAFDCRRLSCEGCPIKDEFGVDELSQ